MTFSNGQRAIDTSATPPTYWVIDDGFRRQIDLQTYSNLFIDMLGLINDPSIKNVPVALPIPTTSMLAVAANGMMGITNAVYLVESNVCRRTITSGAVMQRWYFNPAKIQTVDVSVLAGTPSGSDIT